MMAGEALPAVHKNEELLLQLLFLVKENHNRLVVQKIFRYAESRRGGKPPSDEGGGFAVRRRRRERNKKRKSLPQSFCCAKIQPPRQRGPGMFA